MVSMSSDVARAVVAVVASTGGPGALAEMLPGLPADLPAAVLVVQHMPAAFTGPLAQRLDRAAAMPVGEAVDGELLLRGRAYVAPGGRHMGLVRDADGVRVHLTDGDPLWGVRPAADLLFAAAARCFGPAVTAVVMTGMGRDGAEGCRLVRAAGGVVLAQDQASSVIAGMPRAAAPWASSVLPLEALAAGIALAARRQAGARSAG
jgi:two-component system, chemotaxis family, protein-glutamate methylesterase/glutaminase